MLSRESAIAKFVDEYDIAVPPDDVEEEFKMLLMNYRRRMAYAQMGGQLTMNPFEQEATVKEMEDEIRETAHHEVKENLVFRKILGEQDFPVSEEELICYAERMAEKEKTDMEMIKKFFGEDLNLLTDSVKRRKAEDWIIEQVRLGSR